MYLVEISSRVNIGGVGNHKKLMNKQKIDIYIKLWLDQSSSMALSY